MVGLPPFISFSTSYSELNAAVLRHTNNQRFAGKQRESGPITSGVAVWVRTATVVQTKLTRAATTVLQTATQLLAARGKRHTGRLAGKSTFRTSVYGRQTSLQRSLEPLLVAFPYICLTRLREGL
jgi:hypothetical protein